MRHRLLTALLLTAFSLALPGAALELTGVSVTPHLQSAILRYRRPPEPGLGARVELFLRNSTPTPLQIGPDFTARFDGKTAAEWLASGDWAWHDTPSARTNASCTLPPGALTVWAFNSRRAGWGAGTTHELSTGASLPPQRLALEAPRAWLSAVTFLAADGAVRPTRLIVHVANQTGQPLALRGGRFWWPVSNADFLALRPQPWLRNLRCFPTNCVIAHAAKGGFTVATEPLPLTYCALEVEATTPGGQIVTLWAHLRIKREVFDLSGGWTASNVGGRNTLTMEPYLKTLKRMHIDTAHIGHVPGYTDNAELHARYPLKYFNRLQDLSRYDTDALLPRIHAVEFLGEPQYGGGRPVPPQEVWRAFLPYHGSRLPTTVTHSEERVWRDYAGLSDYPHYDAYRVAAPAADAWNLYARWGGQRIRWGAPLETIGDLTRSLRELNRPKPIAYWSQGAHDGWSSRSRRGSPTPDELRAQAYHALGSRITSLYWFNLSLKSLVKFRDLIEPITRVNREIRLLDDLLLEGDAFEYRRVAQDGKPDWDLASVTGPDGGVFFAHDLAYSPDQAENVFRFEARDGSFQFQLPDYLREAAEVFRLDADGLHAVDYSIRNHQLEVKDRVRVAGIYVASAAPGLRARLQREHAALFERERGVSFDPGGSDADFAQLKLLLSPTASSGQR